MSARRPIVYLAVLAVVLCAGYLYDHSDTVSAVTDALREGTVLVEPADRGEQTPADSHAPNSETSTGKTASEGKPATGEESASGEEPVSGNNKDIDGTVYRTGWAELPAERADGDRRYVHHLCGGDGVSASWRSHTACFSVSRRCPVWVAAPLHGCYRGDSGRSGGYAFDPALPVEIQPSLKRSYGEYTRGHLLASADRTVSAEANRMTFMPTNIAPQTQAGFNAAGGAWNNLEAFVEGQVCPDTLYVVTGCIFSDYTDPVAGKIAARTTVNKNDGETVAVPTAYYKVLLRTRSGRTGRSVRDCAADELKCAAFVVGHRGVRGREVTEAEMISVADLERMTGERFFVNVPAAPKSRAAASDWGL